MAQKDVKWTKTADLQFAGILKYWVDRNKSIQYSKKLISIVEKRTSLIAKHPFIFPESAVPNIRFSVIGHFRLFYMVYPEAIIVTAFWDCRQNPEKLRESLELS